MVGVSNDAANFLNSAVGSKVTTIRTIMIVASIGIGIGAIFSNGMMEIAKSGIFNPQMFYFEEIYGDFCCRNDFRYHSIRFFQLSRVTYFYN